jgi:hypothetical protein
VLVDDMWGFIDRTGAFAIPPQYEDSRDFRITFPATLTRNDVKVPRPLAAVKTGGKWGYIDLSGKQVIRPQFDKAFEFTPDGVAPVTIGGKSGYIDMTGAVVVPAVYDDTLLATSEGWGGVKQGDLWGFANVKTGQLVIAPRYDRITEFVGGVAGVQIGGLWGWINPDGSYAITPQYLDADMFDPRGMTIAKTSTRYGVAGGLLGGTVTPVLAGKYGFIERTGMFAIPPQYEDAFVFSEGLARVQVNGKVGFIDRTGVFVIPPQFVPDPNPPKP